MKDATGADSYQSQGKYWQGLKATKQIAELPKGEVGERKLKAVDSKWLEKWMSKRISLERDEFMEEFADFGGRRKIYLESNKTKRIRGKRSGNGRMGVIRIR